MSKKDDDYQKLRELKAVHMSHVLQAEFGSYYPDKLSIVPPYTIAHKPQKEQTMENIWNKFDESKPTKEGEYIIIYADHTIRVESLKGNGMSNTSWFSQKPMFWTPMVYQEGYKYKCQEMKEYMKYKEITKTMLCTMLEKDELDDKED